MRYPPILGVIFIFSSPETMDEEMKEWASLRAGAGELGEYQLSSKVSKLSSVEISALCKVTI